MTQCRRAPIAAPVKAAHPAAGVSAINTGINGGSLGQAAKAAIITFATAEAFNVVGDLTYGHLDSNGLFGGQFKPSDYVQSPWFAANIAGHAAVGCAAAAAGGGQCGPAAFAAAITAAAAPAMVGLARTEGAIASAVVGGTASVIGGGKFQNGAVTAT